MEYSYTERLNKILQFARQEAGRLGNNEILPDHLILGILRLQEGKAYELLLQAGADADDLKRQIDRRLFAVNATTSDIPFSRAASRILRLLTIEAGLYETDTVGSVHLLLSVLRERVNFPAMYLSQNYSIDYERIESLYPKPHTVPQDSAADYDVEDDDEDDNPLGRLGQLFGQIGSSARHNQSQKKASSDTPALDKYGRNLTRQAAEGKPDPVVGRREEIERVMQILARRKKNNPILIGEPGVGKSAIVEGLAQEIVRHPADTRKIISLDIASIVAGTTYRGQFEQRMKDIVSELRRHPEIILFIDEIHTLVGAGNAQGSLDAANILKPALARGEVQCIGATTTAEYRSCIEKDGALERRFQKVTVRPNTQEETYKILKRLAVRYGEYHRVTYSDAALKACVDLTSRYVSDRALPDKAIDAMDEAGAQQNGKVGATVEVEDVAQVVSMMSGVPVRRVAQKENEQLLHMDEVLRRRVIGQDEAIERLVRAIRRSRLGLRDPHRPIGTFFFLGPTGVGKTYLAQCLAEEMFGSRDAIIRFDMSEYMEKHTVSLLVGAPPGYIAHEDGGKLTEAVRRKPYSIVLFDEIEKAHPDIFNVLLQVLDEGRMTDRQGHSVDFRNTIIILTSNVGTRQLRDFGTGIGFAAGEMTKQVAEQTLKKALEKTFPPEFVNRIDDIISFEPLSRTTLAHIVDIEVGKLVSRMKQSGRTLVVTDNVKQQLLDIAYDPKNGARPIRRAVQTQLEDRLTDILLIHPNRKTITISTI